MEAYDNALLNLNPYIALLNPAGNYQPYAGNEEETKQRFEQSANDLTEWIENRIAFMQSTGWIDNFGDAEKRHIQTLYQVANYLKENTSVNDIKNRLEQMCGALNAALLKDKKEDITNNNAKLDEKNDNNSNNYNFLLQTGAAISATLSATGIITYSLAAVNLINKLRINNNVTLGVAVVSGLIGYGFFCASSQLEKSRKPKDELIDNRITI